MKTGGGEILIDEESGTLQRRQYLEIDFDNIKLPQLLPRPQKQQMTRSTSKNAHTSAAPPDFGASLDERPKESQSHTVQERAPVQLKYAKARKATKKGRK